MDFLRVLLSPVITEKSSLLGERTGVHVFYVARGARRVDVARAVEGVFGVVVDRVNILNVRGKTRVYKGRKGVRIGRRKAYVRLASGQSLNVVGV